MRGRAPGERSADRVNRRNSYRERRLDSRVGTLKLAIPKLRRGSYFPDWLLEGASLRDCDAGPGAGPQPADRIRAW